MMRRTATGQFELPIPASEAIGYFTPEGERSWAPGWNPTYPTGEVSEDTGTVFVTSHGDTPTHWVIQGIDRQANTSANSIVTIGQRAGTIQVRCNNLPDGGCRVDVEYRMTALDPNHPEVLDHYGEDTLNATMHHWSEAVHAAL